VSSFLEDARTTPPFDRRRLSAVVSRTTGKSPLAQRREIFRLQRSVGLVTAEEYYAYRLYDDSRFAPADTARFLGLAAQNRILTRCTAPGWRGIVHDKVLFQVLMEAYGFPMPRVVATYHRERRMPGATTLRSAADVGRFLRACRDYPLFGKPVDGMYSLGTVRLESYDAASDEVSLATGATVGVLGFVRELARFAERGYLFQEVQHPDPAMRDVCGDRVACLRVVLLLRRQAPELFRALWKVPAGPHVVDNFWRQGNLLAAVDIPTGRVTRVVAGVGPDQQEHERHPDTGQVMVGFAIPRWAEVKELCLAAARPVAGLAMQAWDVAVGPAGPVIIEANVGGDFNLPQLAASAGLLDETFSAFLCDQGYDPGSTGRRTLAAVRALAGWSTW
jgi:hypothetical protein